MAAAKKTVKETRVYVIAGTDGGRVREEALNIFNKLTGGVDDGFSHETIDGNADNSEGAYQIASAVAGALATLPMFGGDKVVWLRNANFFGDDITGRASRTEEGVELLRAVLEAGLSEGVSLVLSTDKPDKRRAFWKFLEKNFEVKMYDKIDVSRDGWQDQVAAVVQKRADELGLEFTRDAMELFVMLAGEQTNQITNELEKLDLYLGEERREVGLEDVRVLVPLSKAAVIFETGKALETGNVKRAIALVDEQLEAEESPVGIMRASVINVVRNLYFARLAIDMFNPPLTSYNAFVGAINKRPKEERGWLPMKKDGSGVNAYPVFMAAKNVRYFSLEALQKILEQTQRADEVLVTSGLDHRLVLHRLIAEIAAGRTRNAGR